MCTTPGPFWVSLKKHNMYKELTHISTTNGHAPQYIVHVHTISVFNQSLFSLYLINGLKMLFSINTFEEIFIFLIFTYYYAAFRICEIEWIQIGRNRNPFVSTGYLILFNCILHLLNSLFICSRKIYEICMCCAKIYLLISILHQFR